MMLDVAVRSLTSYVFLVSFAPSCYIVDATEYVEAVASAPLPQAASNEFYRHTLGRGAWARFLDRSRAWRKAHDVLGP